MAGEMGGVGLPRGHRRLQEVDVSRRAVPDGNAFGEVE
jgi:hypothetical protein